jgi:hypothetical protein
MNSNLTAIERVLKRTIKQDDGCWIFQGAKNCHGYGMIGLGKRSDGIERCHRVSYRHFIGEIPKGMFICHKCDVPACVNPEHLFIGTPKDNHTDMRNKNRHSNPPRNLHDCGEYRYNSKLNDDLVRNIRIEYSHGASMYSIAKRLQMSNTTISKVINRLSWKHVA